MKKCKLLYIFNNGSSKKQSTRKKKTVWYKIFHKLGIRISSQELI
jgi:hypothetical protein